MIRLPKWTKEQLEAIELEGNNIIVSAGAGSGKTAVLSERVLHKLLNGVHIDELLILTFTRAAAEEMKDRIRKKIRDSESLKEELDALESAYITTFDSFALSVVKKYHYTENIPNDIAIADDTIVRIQKKKILDEIFEDFYKNRKEDFCRLVRKFCVKSDTSLRNGIAALADKIENYIDRDSFFNFIEKDFFDDANLNSIIDEFENLIFEKKRAVKRELSDLHHYFDSEYLTKVESALLPILNSIDIDEFSVYHNVKLPPVPRGTGEEAKDKKASLKKSIDSLLTFSEYGNREKIKVDILSTKDSVLTLITILKGYFTRLALYKKENDIYTFQDIALLAIKMLQNHENVRLELKNQFQEIMIDEYQDTNDIQETFIGLISSSNVYMVGDVKQSIYRFRGSNPNIFKNKYDNFSKNRGGFKIDLIKNFRSRNEVLDNINRLFDLIMDNNLGGAEYSESHEMIFGNSLYEEQKLTDFDYNFEILEYSNAANSEFSDIEIEIFAIARDIKKKISEKIQVFDKDTSHLRKVRYSDFVIILDRSKYFETFKKIFEFLNIPMTILKDGKLNSSTDILIIRNIVDLIIRMHNNDYYSADFKYDFMSVSRSFLYEYTDEYLFEVITQNRIKETTIYSDFAHFENYNALNCSDFFEKILDITDFYNKINKIGDYENINVRLSTIYEISASLGELGYTISEFRDYLDSIIENDYEIKYTEFNSGTDSVKIMTIHKSKGLEYPFCYFADLNHEFNASELKNSFICDEQFGIIAPPESGTTTDSVIKVLYKNRFIREEIGEKIRLFYVALTRAREKMIIVIPESCLAKPGKEENGTIDIFERLKITKLSEFIFSCKPFMTKYFQSIDVSALGLTKNYLNNKELQNIDIGELAKDFTVEEISVQVEKISENHFSKSENSIINHKQREIMNFGTRVHEILEYTDFKNFDENAVEDEFIKSKIVSLLKNKLFKNIEKANIYREYEFYYEDGSNNYHGIIDLMLEYDDHIDIVDYKLKNVDDLHYINQLSGYKNYIQTVTDKPVNIYLYSIIDESLKELS